MQVKQFNKQKKMTEFAIQNKPHQKFCRQ